ncbi:hypothetical protein AAEX28_05585 [Lentisphaerota bacterium WC36G]|nr:hypothetical protein LJT99_08445 [Lentisphaerae bacterium WC36]
MNEKKDLTVRESTIFVLEQSAEGFEVLKDSMLVAATAFEQDNNTTAIEIINEKVTPCLADLCRFCGTLQVYYHDVLGEKTVLKLTEKLKKIEQNMNEIISALEDENFIDSADILRYDFSNSLDDLATIFPLIKETFEQSNREDLDKFAQLF